MSKKFHETTNEVSSISIPVNQSGLGEILLAKLNLWWDETTVNTFIADDISLDDRFKGRASIKLRMTPLNDYNRQAKSTRDTCTTSKTRMRQRETLSLRSVLPINESVIIRSSSRYLLTRDIRWKSRFTRRAWCHDELRIKKCVLTDPLIRC